MQAIKLWLCDVATEVDDFLSRVMSEMTWGLGVILGLSAVWLCFGT